MEYCKAWGVAELGEMLLEQYFSFKNNETKPSSGDWFAAKIKNIISNEFDPEYESWEIFMDSCEDNEADARTKMLIYLLENKLIDHATLSK